MKFLFDLLSIFFKIFYIVYLIAVVVLILHEPRVVLSISLLLWVLVCISAFFYFDNIAQKEFNSNPSKALFILVASFFGTLFIEYFGCFITLEALN